MKKNKKINILKLFTIITLFLLLCDNFKFGRAIQINNRNYLSSNVPVQKITLYSDDYTYKLGRYSTFKVESITPGNASNKNVNWSASNNNVELKNKTNNSVKVYCKKEGTSVIKATAKDGSKVTATKTVTCSNSASSKILIRTITLYSDNYAYKLGRYSTFKVESITPTNATNKNVTWSASNNNVELKNKTNNSVKVYCKKEGETVITAAAKDGSGVKTSKVVTCSNKTNNSNPVNPNNRNLKYVNYNNKQILVVNKTYSLPSSYSPQLVVAAKTYTRDDGLSYKMTSDTYEAFKKMYNAAKKDKINLYIISAYRTYNKQQSLYNDKIRRSGKKQADLYVARPGHSEHQTGMALDLNSVSNSFKDTKEAKWIKKNCHKYGFILRYPEGKKNKTGFGAEAWHIRYVGTELAKTLYNKGNWITLEEYFALSSSY